MGPVKWLLTLVVLLALLVGADRLAVQVAEARVAEQLRSTSTSPSVEIDGFPFLTQALRGRYTDIQVDGVLDAPFATFHASLKDAQIPPGAALSGNVTQVPVRRADGTVVVPYAELAQRFLGGSVQVTAENGNLRVTGSVTILGQKVSASILESVAVEEGRRLVTEPIDVKVDGLPDAGPVRAAVVEALRLDGRLPELPYALQLTGVTAAPDGLRLSASAEDVIIPVR